MAGLWQVFHKSLHRQGQQWPSHYPVVSYAILISGQHWPLPLNPALASRVSQTRTKAVLRAEGGQATSRARDPCNSLFCNSAWDHSGIIGIFILDTMAHWSVGQKHCPGSLCTPGRTPKGCSQVDPVLTV